MAGGDRARGDLEQVYSAEGVLHDGLRGETVLSQIPVSSVGRWKQGYMLWIDFFSMRRRCWCVGHLCDDLGKFVLFNVAKI